MLTCLIIFLGTSAMLGYTYFGYPILLWFLSRWRRPKKQESPAEAPLPSTTLLITAHNEARILPDKLANLSKTEFPGTLEILFVLDGATDQSQAIIEAFAAQWNRFPIRVYGTDRRVGKEKALNLAMQTVTTEAIAFSDADSMYEPQTIQRLVRAMTRPGVGAACGHERQIPKDQQGAGEGNGLFYRYENKVKELLTHVSSLTYIQGGVFSMWRSDYPSHIPEGLTQDGVLVFTLQLRRKEVVFVEDARSTEVYVLTTKQDFSRRIRTITRAFASVLHHWPVLLPWKTGFFGFHLVSHRVLRWWTLPLMAVALVSNVALVMFHPIFWIPLGLQIAFWLMAAMGWWLENRGRRIKLFYIPFYFVYLHLAAGIAVCNAMLGKRIAVWTPSQRPASEATETIQPKANPL